MDTEKRKSLTKNLSKLSVEIAAALRGPMRTPGAVYDAAVALHREEQVGDAFDLWTDMLSRRAAVLWVLKSLYVRILEDRGLLQPRRILDAEDELFRHLAPNLGPTAYLRWVYRDLASLRGGLPELFAPQPAELAPVPDALSQRLIDFWRSKNPDTGELVYRFDDEHFDSRLMGDLYQDLNPVVKKRYALLQTPDFVLDFILDETLTPAIAEWGVETVRVLDPACGSGHFLLAAFKRLVAGMRTNFPMKPVRDIVEDVLARVVGIDLNDYACGLARARLVMTALESCGEMDLAGAASFHPCVFWADALEQVEAMEQIGLSEIAPDHRASMGLLTPLEARVALRPVLQQRFHVVVGNPPYITEKDPRKRDYHKAKAGKHRRYLSASGKYSLGAPFTERMLALATDGGRIGEITADSFMKRKFGKALIEQVLARKDLTKVVATSGAYIPGHGTPTVIVFARNRSPQGDTVRVVMSKRGEPGRPANAATGKVWSSIVKGHATAGFEDEFISVADLPRKTMNTHEWSIGGSEALAALETLRRAAVAVLGTMVASTGFASFSGEDDAFIQPRGVFLRSGIAADLVRPLIKGEDLRDWASTPDEEALSPYDLLEHERLTSEPASARGHLWRFRALLRGTKSFGEKTKTDDGKQWWEWYRWIAARYQSPAPIAYAYKATHNHFVRGASGQVFRGGTSCGTIKLPAGATEEQHLVLLAQLNTSVGDFWVKQTCQTTGGPGGGKTSSNDYENFYERDGSKLENFPLAATSNPTLEAFARALDRIATQRREDSATAVLSSSSTAGASSLRVQLASRRSRDSQQLWRMVGLQEELDWYCYKLYGVDPDGDARVPDAVPPLAPGLRPFEIALAQEDVERREGIARGDEAEEAPSQWFSRHGWDPQPTFDLLPERERTIVQGRMERTLVSRELSLFEQPMYKRRWYRPDYEKEEHAAMERWLDERLEAWGKARPEPFTAAQAGAGFRSDAGVLAVGELLTGRSDFDVDALIEERLRLTAVPNLKHHVFNPEGLIKRAEWERSWEEQHKEDRGAPAKPEVAPKYDAKDYLKKEYWSLRGKLDVPKERFVAFTEVPPPVGSETLYGWAGWTPRERAKAMLGLDEKLEAANIPVADRHGLLYGVWFLLPYVAWESPEAARDFRADVRSLVGENGVTEAMLDEWSSRFPPPKSGRSAKPKATAIGTPKKGKRAKAKEDAEP